MITFPLYDHGKHTLHSVLLADIKETILYYRERIESHVRLLQRPYFTLVLEKALLVHFFVLDYFHPVIRRENHVSEAFILFLQQCLRIRRQRNRYEG